MKKKVVSALAACALASGLGVAALGPATAASPMVASHSASSSIARPAAAPHIDSQHSRTTLAQKHSVGEPVPSYTVYDLFATWEFTETLDARLNVGNVTDEEYYLAAYRSGSFLYYGDARNVRLTVNYVF